MIRPGYLLISLMFLSMLLSCQKQRFLVIEPISAESNETLLSGKNLDTRLYGTKVVFQYYQLSGYNHLPNEDLALKIDSFVKLHYPVKQSKHWKTLTIWFYKKHWYSDYDKLLYESARENENGSLTDHAEDVLARVDWEFLENGNKTLSRHTYVYYPERIEPLVKIDTVHVE